MPDENGSALPPLVRPPEATGEHGEQLRVDLPNQIQRDGWIVSGRGGLVSLQRTAAPMMHQNHAYHSHSLMSFWRARKL